VPDVRRRWALVASFHHDEAAVLSPVGGDAEKLRATIREWLLHERPWEARKATHEALRGIAYGVLDEAAGWELILEGARALQRKFRSWDALADAWRQDVDGVSDGRASGDGEAREMLAAAGELPWDLDLGGELPIRQRFALAIAAPAVAVDSGDPRVLGGWRGRDAAHCARTSLEHNTGAVVREQVLAYLGPRLRSDNVRDLVDAAAAASWAGGAEILAEQDAWQVLLVAAAFVQRRVGSWEAFADACATERKILDELLAGWWTQLPWSTDLEVQIAAAPRYLVAACPSCGATTARPAPTAYVYCDICAALVGYDFQRACTDGLPQPGPAYEALRAELAPLLDASSINDCRRAQLQLFEAYVDACPAACPIRVRDASYRARYVAYLAEAATRTAFDRVARELTAAMTAAVGALVRDAAGRFGGPTFRALCDAVFALAAHIDALHAEHGVYAMHPDGASRELQRSISNSLFVQGWAPYLEPADASALLERTGLALAYSDAPPPATRVAYCQHCTKTLEVLVAARQVVCKHCGHITPVAEPERQGYIDYR
jgi:hypothetical protein